MKEWLMANQSVNFQSYLMVLFCRTPEGSVRQIVSGSLLIETAEGLLVLFTFRCSKCEFCVGETLALGLHLPLTLLSLRVSLWTWTLSDTFISSPPHLSIPTYLCPSWHHTVAVADIEKIPRTSQKTFIASTEAIRLVNLHHSSSSSLQGWGDWESLGSF